MPSALPDGRQHEPGRGYCPEALAELDRRGVLTFEHDRLTGFNRDEALRLLDEYLTA